MKRVKYLGYIIHEHGVHVNPSKIKFIHELSATTTLIVLQIFLGIANFYRRLVLGFSPISWALSQVTKGGGRKKFMWGKEQQ